MSDVVRFEGVLPALITPFVADGSSVDVDALDLLVERCIEAGVGGLVPTGSTGEFTTLSTEERHTVLERVVKAAAGRVPTIAGCGALSTAETIALSVHAEETGAAAVMIVPPFYDPLTWRELVGHFAAVAERVSIPIMFYNYPAATGLRPSADQLAELRRVAGVSSFKDTGGDAVAATEFFQRGEELPTLLNGYDTLTFSALAAGVRGVIWGAASIIPKACVELHHLLIEEADLRAARVLWSSIWPLCRFLESTSYVAAVKAGCSLVGLPTGPVRAPLLELSDAERDELVRLIEGVDVRG